VGDGSQTQGTLSYYPTTPMVLDVLAAQALYGANTSYHSGNDTYAFSQNATTYMTIWDGGGGDALSIAGNTKAGFLDLRPGEYSDVGSVIVANTAAGSSQITRTVGIAFGAVIENAIGGSGNDTVIGNDADNSVAGGRGNDTVDGGLGSNTSVYFGASGNYVVTAAAGASAITVQDRGGTDGTDTLTNIQKLQFSDQTIDVSWLIKAASLPAAQINALADVYIAYFNRAPDALGLDYWASRLADGVSLADIAKSFSVQPESVAAFPATQSSSEFVTKVYNNVLGRAPDTGGLDYWVGELQNGHVSRDVFLLAIINGV
jgi:Ca2+-binding RTX toxin-like protein